MFHAQKSVCNFNLPFKSYQQISVKVFEFFFKMSLPTCHWNLLITFEWKIEIANRFLGMKHSLIIYIKLVQSFLKKVILLCLNQVWNSNLNTNFTSNLTMSGCQRVPIPYGLSWLLPPHLYKALVFFHLLTPT